MTRFFSNGIEVPGIPKLYLWPDGGWRPEEPLEEGVLTKADLGNHVDFEAINAEKVPRSAHIDDAEPGTVIIKGVNISQDERGVHLWNVADDRRNGIANCNHLSGKSDGPALFLHMEPKPGEEKDRSLVIYNGIINVDFASVIDNGPTPPKEPEAEEDGVLLHCPSCESNEWFVDGVCCKCSYEIERQPEKSLRQKVYDDLHAMRVSVPTRAVGDGVADDTAAILGLPGVARRVEDRFREHVDFKREALSECIADWMEDADAPDDLHERLRATLFGEDA